MTAKSKNKKVGFSLGILVIGVVFVYFAIHMITYVTKSNPAIYQIGNPSSLTVNDTFQGLIIRKEKVITSENAGSVNFYIRSGEKIGIDEVVYSIDENGKLDSSVLSNNSAPLTNDEYKKISNTISSFSQTFSPNNFSNTYTLKNNIENSILSFGDIKDHLSTMGLDERSFHLYKSISDGIAEVYTDGYENIDPSLVNDTYFDQSKYKKTEYKNGDKVSSGAPLYKTISDEEWEIVVKLTEDTAKKYYECERLNITFPTIGINTTALFKEIVNSDGNTYGVFTLSKYLIHFIDYRYLTITINNNKIEGLKIPTSAIASEDFYKISKAYVTKGGGTNASGFNLLDGSSKNALATFKEVNFAFEDDSYVYIKKASLELGSVLVKPDSDDRCVVSETAPLPGVFNVNQGYASFKIINIIDKNDDYAIIKSGESYSVHEFDNILLDSNGVKDGDKIY